MSCPESRHLESIFEALNSEPRLKILKALSEREQYAAELVALTGFDKSTVSHHMTALKTAGFVRERKWGNKVIYTLVPDAFPAVFLRLLSFIGIDTASLDPPDGQQDPPNRSEEH